MQGKNSNFEDRISHIKILAQELRDISFHVKHTDPIAYGNDGFDHGRVRLLDDNGQTRDRDADALIKVADLFEQFFCPNGSKEKSNDK